MEGLEHSAKLLALIRDRGCVPGDKLHGRTGDRAGSVL
jgi:hypothetical protein